MGMGYQRRDRCGWVVTAVFACAEPTLACSTAHQPVQGEVAGAAGSASSAGGTAAGGTSAGGMTNNAGQPALDIPVAGSGATLAPDAACGIGTADANLKP